VDLSAHEDALVQWFSDDTPLTAVRSVFAGGGYVLPLSRDGVMKPTGVGEALNLKTSGAVGVTLRYVEVET
jgi:hypothetical protein